MSSRCVLGIDVGTTSMKAVIIDGAGHILAEDSAPHSLVSRYPTWAEEDPEVWWKNVGVVTAGCLQRAGLAKADIAAVGVSGMVPALIVLDEKGVVRRPSIQQNDARAGEEIVSTKQLVGEQRAFELTGSSINQQSIGPKLLWLRQHEPEVERVAHAILGSYDYINFKLTGTISTDKNWALESGLYNPKTGDWEKGILDALGVSPTILPKVQTSGEFIGTVTAQAAEETGLKEGTTVVVGCADHVASTFAAGIVEEGEVNIKFGGAGDILYSSDRFVSDARLYIDYHLPPGKYLLNGCMASSGSLLKWFVDQFCEPEKQRSAESSESPYAILDEQAARTITSLVVLPYFIGEKTPILDPQARGVIFGLGLNHTRVHVYRAVLESVAFGFRHHLDVMRETGSVPTKIVATDGGARSGLWRQIAADVIGLPVLSISNNVGSSLGAAFVAAMAAGIYGDWKDIASFVAITDTASPAAGAHSRYTEQYQIYRELYQRLKGEFPKLAPLERSATLEGRRS